MLCTSPYCGESAMATSLPTLSSQSCCGVLASHFVAAGRGTIATGNTSNQDSGYTQPATGAFLPACRRLVEKSSRFSSSIRQSDSLNSGTNCSPGSTSPLPHPYSRWRQSCRQCVLPHSSALPSESEHRRIIALNLNLQMTGARSRADAHQNVRREHSFEVSAPRAGEG